MKTTIDPVGRIVVPLAIRRELGLEGGETVEITVRGGVIEIEVVPTPMRLERQGARPVAVPEVELPGLEAETVRDTLERLRR